MRPSVIRVSVGACLLFGAVACGGRSDPAQGDLALFLADRTFLLDHAEGWAPLDGTRVRLQFWIDELTFHAGCNSHGAVYRIEGGALETSSHRMSAMGCTPALNSQDDWVTRFMTESPQVDLGGNWLILSGETATLTFLDQAVADRDRSLTGQPWLIDELMMGTMSATLPTETSPFVVFRTDGVLVLETICNTGQGTYQASGTTLTFGDVGYTKVGCGTEERTRAEAHINQVFGAGTASYRIEAARLTVERADGVGVTARAGTWQDVERELDP
jgi:heat shock protein HslJ